MLSMKIHILKRGLPLGKPSFLYLVYFLFQEISYYLWHLIHGTNGLVTYRSTADLFYGSWHLDTGDLAQLIDQCEIIFLCIGSINGSHDTLGKLERTCGRSDDRRCLIPCLCRKHRQQPRYGYRSHSLSFHRDHEWSVRSLPRCCNCHRNPAKPDASVA